MSQGEFKKLEEVNEEERVKILEQLSEYLLIDDDVLMKRKEGFLERMVTHPDFNCEIEK